MRQLRSRTDRHDLSRLNVLVVDDNRNMLNLMKTLLAGLQIKNVRTAADAAEAFKELKHFAADVIFVDWMMAPLDGCDFTRLVRTAKDSPNPAVPIIMFSGHTEEWRVMQAREADINQFLAKPISAHAVLSRILAVMADPVPLNRRQAGRLLSEPEIASLLRGSTPH